MKTPIGNTYLEDKSLFDGKKQLILTEGSSSTKNQKLLLSFQLEYINGGAVKKL